MGAHCWRDIANRCVGQFMFASKLLFFIEVAAGVKNKLQQHLEL
jgi:hypothetical protein